MSNSIKITKDPATKKITIDRYFEAPLGQVWSAWTESELLDQWWAPNPWQAETKTMDFKPGGYWLYVMVGPDGTKHWARVNFITIDHNKSFSAEDFFCDDLGNKNEALPTMKWKNDFRADGAGTRVTVEILFDSISDLEKLVELGFESGFTSALTNLDRYLKVQFQLRKEYKTNTAARVSTYLNFPGKTEEAFNFYKQVFDGKFTGVGLRRFGDVEMPKDAPPLDDATKKLIIHAELTILGGHVLMATDSPESMGFKMEYGNNMHVNLEPDSREETKRLFDALSQGGNVTMPLSDMFWGAYFGSFTDKYGINWMLNYQSAG